MNSIPHRLHHHSQHILEKQVKQGISKEVNLIKKQKENTKDMNG